MIFFLFVLKFGQGNSFFQDFAHILVVIFVNFNTDSKSFDKTIINGYDRYRRLLYQGVLRACQSITTLCFFSTSSVFAILSFGNRYRPPHLVSCSEENR